MGSYRTYWIPSKSGALFPEFAVEDLSSAELQPRFLRLQWKTCPWAEHSHDVDDDYKLKKYHFKILEREYFHFDVLSKFV